MGASHCTNRVCDSNTATPPCHVTVLPTALPPSRELRQVLLNEVSELLHKRAIYPVYPPFREGFWSSIFLAPKKTGDWRPVLNLKPLNKFVRPSKLRMESLASVLLCSVKGMWAASLDLEDAYLHVPIRKDDQKWISFQVNNHLPVQVPAVWAVHGPQGFYPGSQGRGCVPQAQGYQPLRLPGRLADLRRIVKGTHVP